MTRALTSFAFAACALLLAACQSSDDPASDETGDCNAKLRIRGTTYAVHPDAIASPPTADDSKPMAPADVLDCDANVVDTATPLRMDGIPVSVAVAVIEDWPGVYVAEGSDPSTWPAPLKR